MKKRLLSLALALVMVCGLLPVTATAATVTETVPPKYDKVEGFHEGLAVVRLGANWGFIDATGKEIVPIGKYDDVEDFSEGLAEVWLSGKGGGFIDTTGKEVVPCKYGWTESFHEGLAAVGIGIGRTDDGMSISQWGFIDTTGKEVVPCKYDRVGDFSDGLAAVKLDGKWGVIDKTGKEVVPCKYMNDPYHEMRFCEGFAVLYGSTGQIKNGQTVYAPGVFDAQGNVVVPFGKYDEIEQFSDGLAAVCVGEYSDSQWGFIDTTGKEVVPIGKYDSRTDFSEGLAVVQTSNGWGCIDLHGNEVVPCQYGGAKLLSEGLVAVQVDGKWGILRVEGLPTEPKPAPAPTPTPTPQQPTTPASTTAYASTQTVTVDGKPVTFYAYALKDANGNDTNYIKLRDVAQILNGSAAQFQVGWDGSITITTKAAYTPNGTENIQNFKGNQTYAVSTSPVTVNGQPTNLEAITLTDANGGGYTYFKLRDLGAALGFDVDWTPEKGITVDSTKPYDGNN